ncbi:CU044_5270 family protein [Actinomadura parmotrematis]|uniref:CU044_5270 family protein n=1 Tax=Actinomadura parmotrematis TaxID=2864039 RepID=A0ABS7FNS5_9ACTN|nr:CU044_5270 family protein [Actinomadura parmotrematis]MBW8482001.1 CU044_5270 family protein [Actinomadura parmotrematis]
MDELQMIATLLDEEPAPRTAAAGRARLVHEIAEPARPRRRVPRPAWAGLGLAATAAAVTGAVALSSGTTAPRAPDPAAAQPVSARSVLLAAAGTAEAAPADGRYWHVRAVRHLRVQVGPKSNRYWLVKRQVEETWTDRTGRSWSGVRAVGAAPASAADTLAWKRDGAPRVWKLGRADTARQEMLTLSAGPAPGALVRSAGTSFALCERRMTVAQALALPADAAALRARLGLAAKGGWTKGCLAGLLTSAPVTPKVRGVAYRALAATPGVKLTGPAADAYGRKGLGLVLAPAGTDPVFRLLIDPRTALVLAERVEQTGPRAALPGKSQVIDYLQAGWTDAAPRVPALP